MSALATILQERGKRVTGSDAKEGGHSAGNVPEGATVIYSTAVAKDNPELREPMLHRSDLLASLLREKKGLLVAGTHGKTSTSGLLAWTLPDATFAIGGYLAGVNGREGGEYFVAEACESDGTFAKYDGYGAIITNVEPDHLDYWGSAEAFTGAFHAFAQKPFAHLFVCDKALPYGTSYGFAPGNDIQGADYRQEGWNSHFTIAGQPITLSMPGIHMATNAIGVYALCRALGLSHDAIAARFATFPGMGRRLERRGEGRFDDYAHHPTEVRAMLRSLRDAFPEREITALFQPHRYTRLRDHFAAFAASFADADRVVITDVYSAGEMPLPGISGEALAAAIPGAEYIPFDALRLDGDIVVTIGAGNITTLHSR